MRPVKNQKMRSPERVPRGSRRHRPAGIRHGGAISTGEGPKALENRTKSSQNGSPGGAGRPARRNPPRRSHLPLARGQKHWKTVLKAARTGPQGGAADRPAGIRHGGAISTREGPKARKLKRKLRHGGARKQFLEPGKNPLCYAYLRK